MKRGIGVVLATALLALLPASLAGAAPPTTAAGFAADCNDDGRVEVTSNLWVVGGTGALNRDCVVVMDPIATLTFVNAAVGQSPGLIGCCNLVVGDALQRTQVRVVRSSIALEGAVQLSPGCCSGDPSRNEADADVLVLNSFVRGATVEVSGSIADGGGRALVAGSTLQATAAVGSPLTVVASLTGGPGGRVSVFRSTLISAAGIRLETGAKGRTVAVKNAFLAAGGVTVTSGGSCASIGNSPDVPCS